MTNVGSPVQNGSNSFPAPPSAFARDAFYLLYYSFYSVPPRVIVLRANGPLGPWTPIWSRRFTSLADTPRLFLADATQWYMYRPSAPRTLWQTENSGKSWTYERTNLPLTEIKDFQFVAPGIGFGLFTKGLSASPVVTRNGGSNLDTCGIQGRAGMGQSHLALSRFAPFPGDAKSYRGCSKSGQDSLAHGCVIARNAPSRTPKRTLGDMG